jgi:hypothetical protein
VKVPVDNGAHAPTRRHARDDSRVLRGFRTAAGDLHQPNPARLAIAPRQTDVAITFGRAIDPTSVNASTVRVFGRISGARSGALQLSNGDRTVTLDIVEPFAAGETVLVNLSHALRGADASPLRAAGYAYAFRGSILRGNGDGSVDTPQVQAMPGFAVSTALGDLDGDGDLDWILAGGGNQIFRLFHNDGGGHWSAQQDLLVPSFSSCATIADLDNDGDLDLALSDEHADVVSVFRNGVASPLPCPPSPPTCRRPAAGRKAHLTIKRLRQFGAQPDPVEVAEGRGDGRGRVRHPDRRRPLHALHLRQRRPGHDRHRRSRRHLRRRPVLACAVRRFRLQGSRRRLVRRRQAPVRAGADGRAKVLFHGRGTALQAPNLAASAGPIDVRLITSAGPTCWGATYSAPFLRNDANGFRDKAD